MHFFVFSVHSGFSNPQKQLAIWGFSRKWERFWEKFGEMGKSPELVGCELFLYGGEMEYAEEKLQGSMRKEAAEEK